MPSAPGTRIGRPLAAGSRLILLAPRGRVTLARVKEVNVSYVVLVTDKHDPVVEQEMVAESIELD